MPEDFSLSNLQFQQNTHYSSNPSADNAEKNEIAKTVPTCNNDKNQCQEIEEDLRSSQIATIETSSSEGVVLSTSKGVETSTSKGDQSTSKSNIADS